MGVTYSTVSTFVVKKTVSSPCFKRKEPNADLSDDSEDNYIDEDGKHKNNKVNLNVSTSLSSSKASKRFFFKSTEIKQEPLNTNKVIDKPVYYATRYTSPIFNSRVPYIFDKHPRKTDADGKEVIDADNDDWSDIGLDSEDLE
jgi:hypothetical protein